MWHVLIRAFLGTVVAVFKLGARNTFISQMIPLAVLAAEAVWKCVCANTVLQFKCVPSRRNCISFSPWSTEWRSQG